MPGHISYDEIAEHPELRRGSKILLALTVGLALGLPAPAAAAKAKPGQMFKPCPGAIDQYGARRY